MAYRKRHETPNDLKNEKQIIERVAQATGLIFHKNPDSYQADFFVCKGDGSNFGWAEVKQRYNPAQRHPEYMISFEKFANVRRWAKISGTVALLFVRFANESREPQPTIYWANLAMVRWRLRWGGRTVNPMDEQDVEPVALIPMADFSTLADFDVNEFVIKKR
jgi:hypothetical protein